MLARSIVEKADLSHDRGGLAFLLLAAFLAALYMIPVFFSEELHDILLLR